MVFVGAYGEATAGLDLRSIGMGSPGIGSETGRFAGVWCGWEWRGLGSLPGRLGKLSCGPGGVSQAARTFRVKLLLPGVKRVLAHAHQGSEIASRQATALQVSRINKRCWGVMGGCGGSAGLASRRPLLFPIPNSCGLRRGSSNGSSGNNSSSGAMERSPTSSTSR